MTVPYSLPLEGKVSPQVTDEVDNPSFLRIKSDTPLQSTPNRPY